MVLLDGADLVGLVEDHRAGDLDEVVVGFDDEVEPALLVREVLVRLVEGRFRLEELALRVEGLAVGRLVEELRLLDLVDVDDVQLVLGLLLDVLEALHEIRFDLPHFRVRVRLHALVGGLLARENVGARLRLLALDLALQVLEVLENVAARELEDDLARKAVDLAVAHLRAGLRVEIALRRAQTRELVL